MKYPEYSSIKAEIEGGIAIITLDKPEKMNAFDDILSAELDDVFAKLEEDDDVNVIVLTGTGKAFCAGGDVKAMAEAGKPTEFLGELASGIHRPIIRMWNMDKAIICAINGHAVGAGCGLAMACDIRVASKKAKFNMGFMNIGLAPGCGTFFLPKLVGRAKAAELIFLSETIDAKEAHRIGLINMVVDGDELMKKVMKMAKRIDNGPILAIGRAKTLLRISEHSTIMDHLEAERHMISQSGYTEDFREGVTAFLEKRKPNFKGK